MAIEIDTAKAGEWLTKMAIRAISFHGDVQLELVPAPEQGVLQVSPGVFRQIKRITFNSLTLDVTYWRHDAIDGGVAVSYNADVRGDLDGRFEQPDVTVTYMVAGREHEHTFRTE